jgi:hypothetical protein
MTRCARRDYSYSSYPFCAAMMENDDFDTLVGTDDSMPRYSFLVFMTSLLVVLLDDPQRSKEEGTDVLCWVDRVMATRILCSVKRSVALLYRTHVSMSQIVAVKTIMVHMVVVVVCFFALRLLARDVGILSMTSWWTKC